MDKPKYDPQKYFSTGWPKPKNWPPVIDPVKQEKAMKEMEEKWPTGPVPF